MWRKKFNIDNKGRDDFRPGQRLINYASQHLKDYSHDKLELWLWNLTPDDFETIMNWSPY